ncbi:helix-turn-helix transcriptional regulator [Microtetraspora sp. NBRC 13810]|uniref:helix-turn-helix transcriptional regulator n=1 Tax=Microtetraspora sp. NBRC 13810 TaxID=3030990 RepID=UPI0025569785|nr:helix-turn-helix transcriptional regulator [Microtetraspora sp. NBRC 13810]
MGDQITIDDMARTAMFSKFHFTRIFQRATGVSPGRFLSAVRLQEAKRLLLSTSMSVTEISHKVGYSSVGTFSTRFKNSVGLSPTAYRELRGFAPSIPVASHHSSPRSMSIQGEVLQQTSSDYAEGMVFIGLFPDTIPQGRPTRCTVLDRPSAFRLDNVPEGDWHLLVQSVAPGEEQVIGDTPPTVAMHGPITIRHDRLVRPLRLSLRPMRMLDPPVLLALLDARQGALSAAAS